MEGDGVMDLASPRSMFALELIKHGVAGVVMSKVTGKPLAGATVTIFEGGVEGTVEVAKATADDAGAFNLGRLVPGTYGKGPPPVTSCPNVPY